MPYAHLVAPVLLVICVGAAGAAIAQAPAPDNRPGARAESASSSARADRRIERIRFEDALSRIDELRVGGETQSITVSPKGGMPAYDIVPINANRNPAGIERNRFGASGGNRVWKILGF